MADLNSGHGWVYRLPGGAKARCGGPGLCSQCSADLERFAASGRPRPANDLFEVGLEAELQQTFGRALEAT